MIGSEINDAVANSVIAQMLYLEQDDPDSEISIYINSPGGVVSSGLAIYDTMQFVRPDVSTWCMGMSASIAALLLAGGTKGKRTKIGFRLKFCLPKNYLICWPLFDISYNINDLQPFLLMQY